MNVLHFSSNYRNHLNIKIYCKEETFILNSASVSISQYVLLHELSIKLKLVFFINVDSQLFPLLLRKTKAGIGKYQTQNLQCEPVLEPRSCCCQVTRSCPILCSSMDYSKPGFPVLHHLLEFAHTHVHGIGDAIQQFNKS